MLCSVLIKVIYFKVISKYLHITIKSVTIKNELKLSKINFNS